jgi:acetoin utilization deacetylase AcuC-like enzyme
MFRIRRIYDDTLALDREAIASAQAMLRERFQFLSREEIEELPGLLRDPVAHGFRTILFVADLRGKTQGFALLMHFRDIRFCYLDFLSVPKAMSSRGLGGALYERVRQEAQALKSAGLFLECLPDDPGLCADPEVLSSNRARLRFYERYGARPIVDTAYETPLTPGGDCPPYLVLDTLDSPRPLAGKRVRAIVRAVLERKYRGVCPPEYVDLVVGSIHDGPVRLRPARYAEARSEPARPRRAVGADQRIALVVNDRHEIHHVHERGYVEAPVRVSRILEQLRRTGLFAELAARRFPDARIKEVHDAEYVDYLKRVCLRIPAGRSVYPYVFPTRNRARPPRALPVRAGYYCMDTFTPLNPNAWLAARRGADCALTAAAAVASGQRLAYALVRPPGHHAERRVFGGFCYLNNAALAAQHLSALGRVAVLDLDYHHGNGTQDIFFARADVLTVSIHGHPSFAYPYFSGFRDERGEGAGLGFNRNFPLQERVDGRMYRNVLARALDEVQAFAPVFLVLALGLDTAKGDPTGSWSLGARDFLANGRMVGELGRPTVVIQEGGYRIRSLGANARHFFLGLWEGAFAR